MKHLFLILCLSLMACCAYCFVIADNGIAKATVVIEKDATEGVKYAADQFVEYTQKISGVTLPISETKAPTNNIYIRTKKNAKENDGINLKLSGSNLFLEGNTDRGTIYSVYEFFVTGGQLQP